MGAAVKYRLLRNNSPKCFSFNSLGRTFSRKIQKPDCTCWRLFLEDGFKSYWTVEELTMKKSLLERVSFDLIRYANVWEDADILLEGLNPQPGDMILSIGSGGDNSFSLLLNDPKLVVAIDINKVQLFLIELKMAAIKTFERKQTLQFLGFEPCSIRQEIYKQIKPEMSVDTQQYWDKNIANIQKGVIYTGKLERYFQLFSRFVLPLIHSYKTIEAVTQPKSEKEQYDFYDRAWNNLTWKLLLKLFFSKTFMGIFGRDPEFLKEVHLDVGDYILMKTEKLLRSVQIQKNAMAYFILHGKFDHLVPHYLRQENYEHIRQNIDKIKLMQGFAEDAVPQYGLFNRMNLSDIFEYMDHDTFRNVSNMLLKGCVSGTRLGYWNLMVSRKISNIFPERIKYLHDISKELSEKDNGFFYNQFVIEEFL